MQIATPLQSRLSPGGFLAFELVVGAIVLIAAGAAFGAIAEQVWSAEELTLLDSRLANLLHSNMGEAMTVLMIKVSATHATLPVMLYFLVLALVFRLRHDRYRLALLTTVIPGGMLLNVALKHAFQRTRPSFEDMAQQLASYSFPSGHTMAATVLWSFVVTWAWRYVNGWFARVLLLLLAALMVLLVGFSRIYLGAHFLSDVLGAVAEGVAWTALCAVATGTWRRARAYRNGNAQNVRT